MEPIAIVKKRSRVWLIMIVLVLAAILVAGALWFMGDGSTANLARESGMTGIRAQASAGIRADS